MAVWLYILFILQLIHITKMSKDFRHISYSDLVGKTVFQDEGVSTYSQLLFDIARQQVIVGARNNLYRLVLDSLKSLEHAKWPAAKEKMNECQTKGQSVEDCHNYIKILLSNGTSLFSCGTNAFSPQCTWREIENINNVTNPLSGIAMCPYSPQSNVTAYLVKGPSGGLFAGTPTDFSGNDAAIYRTLVKPNLRTRQYDSKWLNDPQFVGSFETKDYIYFLFRESAVEYINCGKRIYSRIARVCKYDPGSTISQKNTWTTFSKARLNCSLPGEFPFYYDEIQGAVYQPDQDVVYATFTTPSNAIAGSAICVFNMSAILAAFDGPFKHQENSGAAWEKKTDAYNRQQCGPSSSKNFGQQLTDNERYQLMDEAVQSATKSPLHTTILERYTHIAVDVTPTQSDGDVAVLYVATNDNLIKKISVIPTTMETCIIEIWGPLPSPSIVIQYLKETKSLYVGTENSLIRIPTIQCHRHLSAQSCLNAMDPYCGWDEHELRCTARPGESDGGHSISYWRQMSGRCPDLEAAQAGGWSAWSPWFSCPRATEPTDSCLCQTRECSNPRPVNGGPDCSGSRVRVTNCTLHGGWTAWSAWSSCSQSCGPAIKTRRRSCTNPAPRYGGRICLGSEHEESFCIELPPCPGPLSRTAIQQAQVWSNWGPWTICSKPCAGGFRMRKRICEVQPHKDISTECPGCNYQIEECNNQPCQEIKKHYLSPWLNINNSRADGYTEKRYRFICRAQTDDPSSVKIQTKEEERYCRADGSCNKKISSATTGSSSSLTNVDTIKDQDNIWTDWSSWSGCSQSCGGGTQYKIRQCRSSSCEEQGLQTESRTCNTRICKTDFLAGQQVSESQWSCWSEWSVCSVSCGFGVRVRARECLGRDCSGLGQISEPCEMPNCESFQGWDSWSVWSSCDRSNVQYRRRNCRLAQPSETDCLGPSNQSRWCISKHFSNDINMQSSKNEITGISLAATIGSCFIGILIGFTLTIVATFYYLKHRKQHIPSSPHYISRQNPYVTVPLKEINTKRQSSFSGSTNGTLRSGRNNSIMNHLGSPKLYPKALEYESATLKRNSREQHILAELEQEKYY